MIGIRGRALLIAASFTAHEFNRVDPRAITAISAAALMYLIVFGSIVAFSAYARLMQRAPASRVATHAYVNPLIAVVLGSAIAREPFTITIAISSLVIAIGVALVIVPSARRVEPAPERFNSAAGSFQRRLSRA